MPIKITQAKVPLIFAFFPVIKFGGGGVMPRSPHPPQKEGAVARSRLKHRMDRDILLLISVAEF